MLPIFSAPKIDCAKSAATAAITRSANRRTPLQTCSTIGLALLAGALATVVNTTVFIGTAIAEGVTADTITIGQSAPLTGSTAELGKDMKAGAEAYFEGINQAGGIGGRKLKLITLDDAGDPETFFGLTLQLHKIGQGR